MTSRVQVRASSRLHFGMFSFGHSDRPQFGGVGIMVAPPNVDVTITPSSSPGVRGDHTARVTQIVDQLAQLWNLSNPLACTIEVSAPRHHSGMGVGTQLSLATALALEHYLHRSPTDTFRMATLLGRAKRSAVGSIGFQHGGMIVDYGSVPTHSDFAFMRNELPDEWRFVLITSRNEQGLMGSAEREAFATLPPVPSEVTERLIRICNDQLTNSLCWKHFDEFGEALYAFGRLAGECFAPVQGGPYASPEIAALIEAIRRYGIPGVGQSSWGPTVFAAVPNQDEAQALVRWLRDQPRSATYDITIARPNNHGAQVSIER